MNIKEAKEEIKKTVEIYLDKDEFGNYTIPASKQRPVFMVGAPGIGKTDIMQQIAEELDVALVSYSMTHHTRQSAIGLPVIETREFEGKKFKVSEYTMSEIIDSVYRTMQESGKREGILFLDEINCVSDTLAPVMLLFLQHKIFGNQKVPDGWAVVTAGNPPQYNKSVKEFDIATLDRLKCLEVTEDFDVWKEYAYAHGVHAAIISFLEINKEWFYSIKTDIDGIRYVTARGWVDLSMAIRLYEKKGFPVDKSLIRQYVTDPDISGKFHAYYNLFQKYKNDYNIPDILSGQMPENSLEHFAKAHFDERISVMGLIFDALNEKFYESVERERVLQMIVEHLRRIKKEAKNGQISIFPALEKAVEIMEQQMQKQIAANNLSDRKKQEFLKAIRQMQEYTEIPWEENSEKDFQKLKKSFDKSVKQHKKQVDAAKESLENAFRFFEKAWGNKQEMVLFLTELTAGADSMFFINQWGSESYFRYNKELLIYDQKETLAMEIKEELGL